MPIHVARFEQLAYASLALGLVIGALDFENLSKRASMPSLIGTLIIAIGVVTLLIWLTARRRQNWARWVFLIFFLVGLPFFVINLGQQSLMSLPFSLLQATMQGVAIYLIFTGDARAWFAREQAAPLPDIPTPKSIERFEQLGYVGLILAVVAAPFELYRVARELQGSAAAVVGGKIGAVLGEFIGIGIGWLLIWLIARRRTGWVRWVFLALCVLAVAYFVANFGQSAIWLDAIAALQIVAWLVALYFAFTPDAAPWFAAVAGPPSAAGEKPKVRMRVAAGQRIVVEPSEATHARKVAAHVAEAGQQGIASYVAAPPLFRLLWAMGIEIPPPLFLGFLPTMLIAGVPFALVWALGNAFVSRISVALVLAVWAGLIFGTVVAAYYRHVTKKLPLPSWVDYLPTQ